MLLYFLNLFYQPTGILGAFASSTDYAVTKDWGQQFEYNSSTIIAGDTTGVAKYITNCGAQHPHYYLGNKQCIIKVGFDNINLYAPIDIVAGDCFSEIETSKYTAYNFGSF